MITSCFRAVLVLIVVMNNGNFSGFVLVKSQKVNMNKREPNLTFVDPI